MSAHTTCGSRNLRFSIIKEDDKKKPRAEETRRIMGEDILAKIIVAIVSGFATLGLKVFATNWLVPTIRGLIIKVPNLDKTKWQGFTSESSPPRSVLEIHQTGTFIRATVRRQSRSGERVFSYNGTLQYGQMVQIGRAHV